MRSIIFQSCSPSSTFLFNSSCLHLFFLILYLFPYCTHIQSLIPDVYVLFTSITALLRMFCCSGLLLFLFYFKFCLMIDFILIHRFYQQFISTSVFITHSYLWFLNRTRISMYTHKYTRIEINSSTKQTDIRQAIEQTAKPTAKLYVHWQDNMRLTSEY